jgi:hypothetical protein
MSGQTLTDPILGTLRPRGERGWFGRVWLTPRHEIEVAFEPFSVRSSDAETLEQLARAGRAYADLRPREWEHRLETARQLLQEDGGSIDEGEQTALARRLCLVQIRLFYGGESALVYHGPPPWQDDDVEFMLWEDGTNNGVEVWPRTPETSPGGRG